MFLLFLPPPNHFSFPIHLEQHFLFYKDHHDTQPHSIPEVSDILPCHILHIHHIYLIHLLHTSHITKAVKVEVPLPVHLQDLEWLQLQQQQGEVVAVEGQRPPLRQADNVQVLHQVLCQ